MLFTDDNYLSDVERVLEKTPDWTKVPKQNEKCEYFNLGDGTNIVAFGRAIY